MKRLKIIIIIIIIIMYYRKFEDIRTFFGNNSPTK